MKLDRSGLPTADRGRAEPDQQPHQRLMCRAGKTCDQFARELRLMASARFDSQPLLCVVLAGDARLIDCCAGRN